MKFSNNSVCVCVSVLCAPPFLLRPSTIFFWTPSSGPPSILADYYSDRHTELCHKTFQFSLSLSKGKRNKKTRTIFFFFLVLSLLLVWGGLKLPDSGYVCMCVCIPKKVRSRNIFFSFLPFYFWNCHRLLNFLRSK